MGKDRADDKICGELFAPPGCSDIADRLQRYSNCISTTATAARYCLVALTIMVTPGYSKMFPSPRY